MSKEKLPFADDEANDSTGFLLWQVTATWQREIAAAIRQLDLTQVQFVLLAGLLWLSKDGESITQIALARHTKVDTMTTSQVLRTLESRKLVERRPHPTDTRAKSLHLTSAGKKLVFEAIPHVDGVDSKFFASIANNRKKFNQCLRSLIDLV